MSWISRYLFSITVAAILCALLKDLVNSQKGSGKIIKLLAGIVLTITVVAPWTKISFSDIGEYIHDFTNDAEAAADTGAQYRQDELQRIIKEQTEAYILDKAAALGAEVQVDVRVSDDNPPIPYTVILVAKALSPYARESLKMCIVNDLGIPEEQQIWS